jgi:hypothetical protein
VIIYTDSGFPIWARVLLTVTGVVVFVVLAWQYYVRFWKR